MPNPTSATPTRSMFRVADIQKLRQVINPRINAYLYTWGPGIKTQEGEQLAVRVQVSGQTGAQAVREVGRQAVLMLRQGGQRLCSVQA